MSDRVKQSGFLSTRRVKREPRPVETDPALKQWAALYGRELRLPAHDRADPRQPHELSDRELFAVEVGNPSETMQVAVAEAAELGRRGDHFKDKPC